MGANRYFFYGFLFVVLLLIQGAPFLSGYRLTADDVAFHQFLMDGWSDSWAFIRQAAIQQGRIVHFFDLPFSLLGSYYADNLYFRFFYTSLYFGNFLLVGLYASVLVCSRYAFRPALFLALVLISFHPLDYFHLAPTAYPFHVSLPVFLIVLSRIGLWRLRVDDQSKVNAKEVAWLSLCFMGMIFSEYGFLVGVSLMFTETLVRTFRTRYARNGFSGSFLYWLRHQYTLKDFFIVALFLALYFGFRLIYPSTYDGNQVSTDFQIGLFLKTLFGHIYGGTSIASFVRYDKLIVENLRNLDLINWLVIFVVFIGTFLVGNFCLRGVRRKDESYWPVSGFLIMALIGFLCAIIVTVPVALTGKYQSWCGNVNSCIFLDSRISYLGVGAFITAFMALTVHLFARLRVSSYITVAVSLFLAFVASFSYVNNQRVEMDMKEFVSAWERAKHLACVPEPTLRGVDISSIVDPLRRVSYHSGFDVNYYWSKYLKDQRLKRNCEGRSYSLADLYPKIVLGERMLAGQSGAALPYMYRGWSSPEPWGTWTNGDAAEIFLPLTDDVKEVIIEVGAFVTPSHPAQDIAIKIDGMHVANRSITGTAHELINIAITDGVRRAMPRGGLLRLELIFENAVSPRDLGMSADNRKLSIGLISVTVR